MQIITSKDNSVIKEIKKLKEKKYRDSNQQFMIEGIKLVQEAIEEKAQIDKIIICEECMKEGNIEPKVLYEIAKYDCVYVTRQVFSSLTEVMNPQGILAVIKKENENMQIDYSQEVLVLLDNIQDPGNLGTIIRTVDSVGLNQVIVSKGSCDSRSPKVVRSTMGAIFRVNIIESENLVKTIEEIKRHRFKVVATSLNTKNSIYDMNYQKKAIIIGNEANGVSQMLLEKADEITKIPMLGKTESLNVSVATSVILYEYVRQKMKK